MTGGAVGKVDGVPAPLPARLDQAPTSEIAASFGDEFVLALHDLKPGLWSGPVASGLGLHLVRVVERSVPAKPSLASVRQRLENDWRAAAMAQAQAQAYERILDGYDVVIAKPKE